MDLAGARRYIATVRWQFAKTMPQWPHEYTVRVWRPDLADRFEGFASLIRETGEVKPWPRDAANPRHHHTYLTVDEWEYWTMGDPIKETTVINRARLISGSEVSPPVTPLSEAYVAAFRMAYELHASTPRKQTTIPYLAHVMSVSALVLENGGSEDCAIAGLLHDAVEDSDDGVSQRSRIEEQFGPAVAAIVEACSDSIAVPGVEKEAWLVRKRRYIDHLVSSQDRSALLVSACDKLHNARAIVADLREFGDRLWERFNNSNASQQLWYYQSLCDAFGDRIADPLRFALNDAVREMTTLASGLQVIDEARLQWLAM
jgi:hypothetical protein